MSHVIFYEKPGCSNNARQKQLLAAAGHQLEVRNLLTQAWTADELRGFFGETPVALWFNKAAPLVKSGAIDPARVGAEAALALMLDNPILIRRPLMEAEGRRRVGFDPAEVDAWIGLQEPQAQGSDLESCRRKPASPATDSRAEDL